MNHVLAVCDSETEYAYQLVDYFSNKKGFPFQVQLFTSEKTLMEYAKDYPVSVAMIAATIWSLSTPVVVKLLIPLASG